MLRDEGHLEAGGTLEVFGYRRERITDAAADFIQFFLPYIGVSIEYCSQYGDCRWEPPEPVDPDACSPENANLGIIRMRKQ